MIPQAVPNLSGNEAQYLAECIESTFVSSVGPFVTQFEDAVSKASGYQASVAVSAGTTGLHAALVALGVGSGDLVILPTYTFIASANAISLAGAIPWLIDIDPMSWTLCAETLAETLQNEVVVEGNCTVHRESGRRIAAIMPVYAFGLPARMDEITRIAARYRLPVIADAAAALGATFKGMPLGDMGADVSVFSFNGNKTVTAGGGGAISGNDIELIKRVRHLTTTARCGPGYDHDEIGFNYRMTNLSAAVGCAQMEQLQSFVTAKRRISDTYKAAFAEVGDLRSFPEPDWARSACWISGFEVSSVELNKRLIAALSAAAIDARPFWKPIHLQTPYVDAPKTVTPVSDDLWERVLVLPSSSGLTADEQDKVINTLRTAMA